MDAPSYLDPAPAVVALSSASRTVAAEKALGLTAERAVRETLA